MRFFVVMLFLVQGSLGSIARAASCCGGGVAVASVLTTDDRAQVLTSISQSRVDTDVFANGVWQKRAGDDDSQVFKIEAAQIFYDRYQYGVSVPIQSRRRSGVQGGGASGLGDVSGQLGYEFLPDWDYNPWRPKGIGFLTITLPTGKSIYESDLANGSDSLGRGFLALGSGVVLSKTWGRYDASSVIEIHRSFDKKVDSSQLKGTVRPGWGQSLTLASGVSFREWRLGASLATTHEDAIGVDGAINSDGSPQQYATGAIMGSYAASDGWALSLSMADQTLFGSPTNTTLSRSILFSVAKRWAR